MNNNLNYTVSKSYLANFAKLVANKNVDFKAINKKIIKYEDSSYLNDLFSDAHKQDLITVISETKANFINKDYQNLINKLDEFYSTFFINKEILDIKGIKLTLKENEKIINEVINPLYINDCMPLYNLNSLINAELEVYIMKHKSGEYVEMSHIKDAIKDLLDSAKATINQLAIDIKLDEETYLNKLKDKMKAIYQIVIEAKTNKVTTIPEWGKGLLFCLPWILGFIIFTLYPLVQTLIFSFAHVELKTTGFETEFIGFTNYMNIFVKDSDFLFALSDYIIEIIIYVPIITIFSLMIALLLNSKVKGTGFFRTIFFLPVIITSGPVMKILIEQGVTSIPGLAEMINLEEISAKLPHFVQTALNILTNEFVMILWFCGIQILVFITGLQKIDKGVYEAANIDGASRWERFWKVTIPALNPTIVINVVFTIVMQSIFALNPIIIKIQTDMNDSSGIKGYGYSSAIAFTYFMVMIILLVIFVCIFKKFDHKKRKRGN